METTSKISYNKIYCLILGMLPVSAVALHVLELVHLNWFCWIVLFFFGSIILASGISKELRNRVFLGWISGIIAVSFYDMSRIPFMYMGWEDFIPKIGGWIVGEDNHFLLGYFWRYVGNGGGLGITFFLLLTFFEKNRFIMWRALFFGLFVCLCLDATLLLAPNSDVLMFPISALSLIGGTIGHVVYGLTLGVMFRYLQKKNRL